MKTPRQKFCVVFFLFCCTSPFIFQPLSCHIDHGLEPIYSKIGGQIFFNGTIPRHTDEVRVAVIKEFPPKSINELLFSDTIPYQQDTATFDIYLPPETYDMVAVIWKEHNRSWNISDVVGLYGGTFAGDILIPTFKPVTIPDAHAVVDTIDIEANFNRVNRNAVIQGTVTFVGQWPENSGAVGVGGFREIPEKGNVLDYYFKSVYIDYGLATFVDRDDYLLRVHGDDTLKYIAALWIDNTLDLTTIQEIGFYRDSQDPDTPGTVTVPKDSIRTGIDITANFSEM